MILGDKIISFNEIDSTNKYAIDNYDKLLSSTVIWSLKQTGGYGRFKRKWVSPIGGLWFSAIFKPLKNKNPYDYVKYFSIAICEYLNDLSVKAQIKWPNDIIVNNKKISGILSQTVYNGSKLVAIIIGIGININNIINEDLKDIAISLKNLTGREYNLSKVLMEILKRTNKIKKKYYSSVYERYLNRRWRKCFAYLEGDFITVSLNDGKKISGTIIKIAPDNLILKDENESIRSIYCGEII
ncbi:MAG: BirA family transcriptional regulator [Kosmotogales bacterium]|nr:BirA family transcriptional regulator [Kosmotogales bacterium]